MTRIIQYRTGEEGWNQLPSSTVIEHHDQSNLCKSLFWLTVLEKVQNSRRVWTADHRSRKPRDCVISHTQKAESWSWKWEEAQNQRISAFPMLW